MIKNLSGDLPTLVTLEGDNFLGAFDLEKLLQEIGTSAAQVTGLVSTVKDTINPPPQMIPEKKEFDFRPFILPAAGLGLILLITLLKGK